MQLEIFKSEMGIEFGHGIVLNELCGECPELFI